MDKIIYNCHNHLFTDDHIPSSYFSFLKIPLVPVMRFRPLKWVSTGLMNIAFWHERDVLERYSSFVGAAYQRSQEANLKNLIDYYPPGTKFVILPMDMSHMGAGKVKKDIDAQHFELAELARNPKYKDVVIPFAHIDPRSKHPLKRLKSLVEEDGFRGVKIYPTLGYRPDDPVLMYEIYPYMVEKNIPLLAHCSPGSVNSHDLPKEEAQQLAHPDHYRRVMDAHPDLRVCLGHFGGISEWERHRMQPKDEDNPTWLSIIKGMMRSGDYPNLYADISYTIFKFEENLTLLKMYLQEPAIADKVLFGSDFYMVEVKKMSEKDLAVKLRERLEEPMFWKIASENPMMFLGETPHADQMLTQVMADEEVIES